MALSEAEVRHVAMLARLELTDEQVEALRTELNSILGHIDAIQQLDLSGVEPMTHAVPMVNAVREDAVPMVNAVREDAVCPGLSREAALLNAPDAEAGAFKIPRITGVGEEGA